MAIENLQIYHFIFEFSIFIFAFWRNVARKKRADAEKSSCLEDTERHREREREREKEREDVWIACVFVRACCSPLVP
jgi:hypothetical protein